MDTTPPGGLARGVESRGHGPADLGCRSATRRSGGSENVIGEPVDGRERPRRAVAIHRDPANSASCREVEIFETRIKGIDLIAPYVRGGKMAIRRCGSRQEILIQSDPQARAAARRVSVFTGVGARTREGNEPDSRDDRVGRARKGGSRLRPSERAARARACVSAPIRAHEEE